MAAGIAPYKLFERGTGCSRKPNKLDPDLIDEIKGSVVDIVPADLSTYLQRRLSRCQNEFKLKRVVALSGRAL